MTKVETNGIENKNRSQTNKQMKRKKKRKINETKTGSLKRSLNTSQID